MKLLKKRRLISFVTCFSLVFQTFLPFTLAIPAYADEATDSGTVVSTPTPTVTPEVSPTPTPDVTVTPDLTPAPVQTVDDKTATFDNVSVGQTYTSKDGKATVTFTEITEPSGNLVIKEITLTPEQIAQSGAVSEVAYDITSSMADGTFKYDLTLPKPATQNIEVKYSEDGQDFITSGGVSTTTDEVIVSDVNHFTIFVVVLAPSWNTPGSGGVFSAYVGPTTYSYLSPGNTAVHDGREAGIIKAGINADTDGHYYDEGLFGFKPDISINKFALNPVVFDVANQAGLNPVWMTIEIDTGTVGDRSDNTIYQFVPTSNPSGWHTVNAGSGLWQKWNSSDGDTTGNPLITLNGVASTNTGLDVVRVYLRLGMGDSYHGSGAGTVAWIDKISFGGTIYDFIVAPACDSSSSFDSFSLGSVNGQGGWSISGPYEQEVVNNVYGYSSFGCKTLRLSDSKTSGSFGDQLFAPPQTNGAGETSATVGSFAEGTLQNHFETQFSIASAVPNQQQSGLHLSVSPDRGDGSRMSYLRFEDNSGGIDVFFYDVQGTSNPANFVDTKIATLDRTVPHTIKIAMDFLDGPSNDAVKVYIDGNLVHNGTSWENYYRYDSEASSEQTPRIVKTVLFRESGSAIPTDAGNGFLIDGFSSASTIINFGPTTNTATDIALTGATVNGMNGVFNANDTSFWLGKTSALPFTASSNPATQLPSGWSGIDSLAQSANIPFNHVYTGLTPNTPYYFVAWSRVGDTWYPGEIKSFSTLPVIQPSVPISGLPNNSYETSNDFYFIWSDSTGTYPVKYEFQSSNSSLTDSNGSLIGAWNSILNGNSEQNNLTSPTIHSTGAPDGIYYWQVRAIDSVGNISAWSNVWKVTIDSTSPATPTGIYFKDTDNNKVVSCGSYTSTKHLDVYWNANTDADFDHYEYVSFNSDGSTGPIRTFTSSYFNSSGWTIPSEGTYGVQIRAVDVAGNVSKWFGGNQGVNNSCKFIVDWQAPSIPVLTWPVNVVTNDNTPLMQWNDSKDSGSGVAGYNYRVRYQCTNASDVATCSAIYPNLLGQWTPISELQAGQTPDGVYFWQVNSQDKVGNASAWSEAEKVIIDTVKPVITIAPYTTSWTNQDITVTAATNEGTLDFASHTFTANGSFTFTAIDAAGNSRSQTVTISNIDKSLPLVSADNSSSSWKNVNFNITLSAADVSGSGISVAKYNWDSAATETTGTDFVNGNIISPSQGSHTLYLFAKDNAGNTQTWSGTYKLDSVAPSTPENISPAKDSYLNTHNFAFSWSTVIDPSVPVKYEWESSLGASTKMDGSFNSRLAFHSLSTPTVNSPGTPDNIYYWHVRALDSLGNASLWSPVWKVTIDTVAPTATINYSVTTPINGSVTATITPSEPVTIISEGGSSHEFTENGSFIFRFVDTAGNTGEVTATVSNIDKTFPTSVITLPSSTQTNQTVFSNSWNGTITGTANDNVEVDHVLLSIKRGSDNLFWNVEGWSEGTESSVRVLATDTNLWSYKLPNPTEDTYTITSHAVDTAGNIENSYSVTIVLDKTIPEVAISINPATPELDNGWYQTQPEVTLTAIDTNFDKIEYQWDGQSDGGWTTYSAPFKPSTEGAHILYYRAWDKANNVSDTGVKNIKWDQTDIDFAPKNVQANPNPTSGTTSKITWEAAGDNVAVNRYEIKWTLNDSANPKSYSKTVASEVRETEIDQLIEGRWTVSVRAFDAAGHNKDAAIDLYVDRTAPAAPVLVLGTTGEGTVSLSWNSIADAKDYIVWYGTATGERLYGARVGLTTSYTVRGLGAGNYYFIVRSVDGAQNQSPESNEVNTGAITGATNVAPGTPAQGFTPQVQGVSTDATPSAETPSILGASTDDRGFNWMWLLLLLIPLFFGVRQATKKNRQ